MSIRVYLAAATMFLASLIASATFGGSSARP